MSFWSRKPKAQSKPVSKPIDSRSLNANGMLTTYGEMRRMAQRQVDGEADTTIELGLAYSILAILEDIDGLLKDKRESDLNIMQDGRF